MSTIDSSIGSPLEFFPFNEVQKQESFIAFLVKKLFIILDTLQSLKTGVSMSLNIV